MGSVRFLAGIGLCAASCGAPDVDGQPPPCVAVFEWDGGDDGVVDGTGIELFDRDRRPLAVVRDWDDDGRADSVERWTPTSHTIDSDGDGILDLAETWVLDDRGRQIERTVVQLGHGQTRSVERQGWLDDDRLLWRTEDEDGDGVVDLTYTYRYDDEGRRVSEEKDIDGDSLVDIWITTIYDAAGRVFQVGTDRQGDGVLEVLEETTYDGPTGLSGTTVKTRGSEGVSEIERVYDTEGRLIYLFEDTAPIDGNPILEQSIGYRGDIAVWWVGSMDLGLAALVGFATSQTLDSADRIVEAVTELDLPDGTTTERSRWRYLCP